MNFRVNYNRRTITLLHNHGTKTVEELYYEVRDLFDARPLHPWVPDLRARLPERPSSPRRRWPR